MSDKYSSPAATQTHGVLHDSAAVIHLEGIHKRFGGTTALDGVTLEVPPGVVFALLGENGAGKTTLIRILTGFLNPDRGQACVLGHAFAGGGQEIRRRIGYVSDAPALYDWMTSEEIGWFTSAFYEPSFGHRYLELMTAYEVPLPPGRLLSEAQSGRQIRWMVQLLPENWRSHFAGDFGITDMAQRQPTLEEIFVAVCESKPTDGRHRPIGIQNDEHRQVPVS